MKKINYNKNKLIDTENRLMVTSREGGEVGQKGKKGGWKG